MTGHSDSVPSQVRDPARARLAAPGWLAEALGATSPWAGRRALAGSLVVLALWAVLVAIGVDHHAFWRDEVRALTLALDPPSILGVPAAVKGEGHPVVWYLLLRAAHDLLGTPHVLSIVGVGVGAIGILLFVSAAPFPLWAKALFVFSGLSIYEYSVMARNYGISMLIMFVAAILIARRRRPYWAIGLALFLLAQTNVSSAMLVPLYVLVLLPDWRRVAGRRRAGIALAAVLGLLGILAAFVTVYPTRHDMVRQFYPVPPSLVSAVLSTIFDPGARFTHLVHFAGGEAVAGVVATLLLYASTIALLPDLLLFGTALLAIWENALFYTLFYPIPGYRHEGLLIVFLITLYWIRVAASGTGLLPRRREPLFTVRAASLAAFGLLLAMNVAFGAGLLVKYAHHDLSMSRSLGAMIDADPRLRNAILLPEPEQIGEALPYYVQNDMYLAREGKYGKEATWTLSSRQELSLGDLLGIAERLRRTTGRPVLILTEPHLTGEGGTFEVGYGWRFSYTPAEFAELAARTTKLPLPRDATDENVDAYLLR